ncbi:MAG: mechanosensitive ion channel [Campylobacterales bacterium]|nr:mechanosensitive ion channel [Campylobacterales bacterium]
MRFVFSLLLISIFFTTSLFAEAEPKLTAEELAQNKELALQERITNLKKNLQSIENEIDDNNVWMKSYSSYLTSLEIKNSLEKIKKRIDYLAKYAKSTSDRDELNALISKENILSLQVEKLKGESDAPFSKLITPPAIHENIEISNPFDIFTGLSLIKTLNENVDEYKKKQENLNDLVLLLRKESEIYSDLVSLDTKEQFKDAAKEKKTQLERFETALDTMSVTLNVYEQRLEIVETNINKSIETQVYRLAKIGTIILFVFLISFLLKLVIKKYITDNQRFYMANKIITFANFSLILLILFFNYIENAGYLVTILGFASAGIAIAMKDWFMSILGWLVIVIGGSINVGDRIRVDMDGMKYVGDVMDISLLRMTLLEDVTLTSVLDNRRAGRIIFIPNNYVFTRMISNYTHNSLKTVWDGIAITITFDSNHKKAMHLTREIAKKFSKGYTDITRKQLNKLRQHYSLKNTNVEPRVNALIIENGLSIETWYLTNAYATLTLRTVISTEIIDAFNKEDDITIAYPTQKLNVSMRSQETSPHQHEIV